MFVFFFNIRIIASDIDIIPHSEYENTPYVGSYNKIVFSFACCSRPFTLFQFQFVLSIFRFIPLLVSVLRWCYLVSFVVWHTLLIENLLNVAVVRFFTIFTCPFHLFGFLKFWHSNISVCNTMPSFTYISWNAILRFSQLLFRNFHGGADFYLSFLTILDLARKNWI